MKNTKLVGAVALLASLVSGHALADSEQKKLTLMLDWFVNPNHGPIVIAQERGYFADQGLDVEIQEPADPSTPAKLVAAGKVDLAVTYQPSLTMDVAAGLPLVRASTLIATPLNTLMVLDNGKNDSLADLKGKKIGIADCRKRRSDHRHHASARKCCVCRRANHQCWLGTVVFIGIRQGRRNLGWLA